MRFISVIAFVMLSWVGDSQKANMAFNVSELRIGEQTTFTLSLEYQKGAKEVLIAWPQFDEMLTDYIEILDRTVDFEATLDSSENKYIRKQEFTVTSFEPGFHKINPIGIELNDTMVYTNSANLFVESVAIDTSKGITDIKENYGVDYSFGEKIEDWFKYYWPYLAGAAALVACYFLFVLIKNRRPEKIIPDAPPIPAHITALKALIELKQKQAWRTEDKKQFYSELTYTVRLYLEERFGIQAIEHTTREIIDDLKFADISEEDKVYLRKILSQADMVKFAKMKPDETAGEDSLYKSIDFVEKTKKVEEENQPKDFE